MELLLNNFLEESQEHKYIDVEIINYTIDGVKCDVSFTHTDRLFETVEKTESINMWDVIVYLNLCNNR